MKKFISIIIFLAIISFIFSSFIYKKENCDKSDKKDYIVYNIEKEPKCLSVLDVDNRVYDLFSALFEGLVSNDSDGNIIPALAESWTLSKDETCYTFKIKQDACYSDGTKITAHDFVKFFDSILPYQSKCKNIEQLYSIIGAEEYSKNQRNLNKLEIRALDMGTLQIKLKIPSNYFLNVLAQPEFLLRNIDESTENWKENFKNIKYTGPYIINNVLNDKEIVIMKNNAYWNKENVKSDKFHITFIENNEEVLANFENGKVDIFKNPPLSEYDRLHDSNKLILFNSNNVITLTFNLNNKNIMNDVNLRKAIAICVNRQEISDEIFNNTAVPALSYIPKGINDGIKGKYVNKNYFSYNGNIDRAKIFLKETNYSKSKDIIRLIYLNNSDNKKLCDMLVKILKEELKLNIQVQGFNDTELADTISKNEYDIILRNNSPYYDYPTALLQDFKCNNIYGYKNSKFDETFIKIQNEKNPWKKKEFIQNCEDILIEDAVIVPILFQNTVICRKDKIDGIYSRKNGSIRLDNMYISDR